MHNLRTRPLGPVTPAGTLTDVITLFRAAREWSIDMDEQLRAEGVEPEGATLGMPLAQVDAILVILDRAEAQRIASEAELAAHGKPVPWELVVACLMAGSCLLALLNVLVRFR